MKKLIGFLVLAFIMTISVNAQQKQERNRKGSDFTPEQQATLMVKRMTLSLDLDDNQQTKVYALFKQNAGERQEKMAEMKKIKENGAKPTSDEKFEMQKNRLDKMIVHKAAMKDILSKDQFEKWEKMAKSKMRQSKQKGQKQGMKKDYRQGQGKK